MNRDFHIVTTVLYSAFTNYVPNSESNLVLPTNGEIVNLSNDIIYTLNNSPGAPLVISIFTDASGQKLVLNKTATNINYLYPYEDVKNDTTISYPGKVTFIFNDGTMFKVTDDNLPIQYYYSLNGLSIKSLT
jgi:hypothetical protein